MTDAQYARSIELNQEGARIPTAWLLIEPIGNIGWLWKCAVGLEEATINRTGRQVALWLLLLLGAIGAAIMQNSVNNAMRGPLRTTAVSADAWA